MNVALHAIAQSDELTINRFQVDFIPKPQCAATSNID